MKKPKHWNTYKQYKFPKSVNLEKNSFKKTA